MPTFQTLGNDMTEYEAMTAARNDNADRNSHSFLLGMAEAKIEYLGEKIKRIQEIARNGTRNTAAWQEVEEIAAQGLASLDIRAFKASM